MYTLSVSINGDDPVVAGGNTLHSVNAILACSIDPDTGGAAQWITLSLGGSTLPEPGVAPEHLRWLDEQVLHVGDTVTMSLRDDIRPDPPTVRLPLASCEESERFMFENCKRAYLALRHQYETMKAP